MFTMYALGKEGASAICNTLNEAGLRNRNGRKWGRRVVLYLLKNPVYVGKIRWREVLYEGQHDGIVSDVLFEKAREVLDERNEELKGRQFHNGDERLLTGIIKCARCKSHMFGGGQKGGRYIPYYVCSKRFNQHECKQDYARAELLEAAIVQDLKAMFRDEDFMARVWAEANKRLGAEKPDLGKEITRVEAEAAKARTSIERYFRAFEAGTLKAELCNRKVQDLHDRVEQLDAEKRELEARRERLELPAIDREMLAALVDNFAQVIAEGPNAQKKDLPASAAPGNSSRIRWQFWQASRPSESRKFMNGLELVRGSLQTPDTLVTGLVSHRAGYPGTRTSARSSTFNRRNDL